jgi:hypothetical protein
MRKRTRRGVQGSPAGAPTALALGCGMARGQHQATQPVATQHEQLKA